MEILLACVRAWLVGGVFCALAQVLLDRTALTPARILVSYVVAGVALGALGWYEPLRRFAGCGVTLPLVGFGGVIAEGVRRAVEEQGVLGAVSGGITAASSGIGAVILLGVIFATVGARGRPKRLR